MNTAASALQTAALALGQRALDTGFMMNPRAARELSVLQGMVIGVEVTDIAWRMFFIPREEHVEISASAEREPDVWIKSDVINLIKARRADPGDGVQLEVSGDVAAGQTFQHILQSIEFDWEELLALHLGDVAAHRIGRGAREVNRWLHRSFDSLAFSTGEYLREEAELAVDPEEVRRFIADVDTLRDDVERLAARLRRLDEGAGG